jgi:tetratricopeptide (TPR) repeat protein
MAKQTVQKVVAEKVSKEDVLIDVAEVGKDAQHWLEVYKNPLLIGIATLAIAVGGFFAWNNYVAGNQKKAITSSWKAEQLFERDSFALALSNPGGGFDGFLDIAKKYGSTPAGNTAHFYAGICYLNLGKFDEAITQLEDFSPNGTISPTMKSGALGDAYSEKKDYAKALKSYKDAANSGNVDDLKAFYLKRYAMLSENQNDVSSALSAYQEIKTKYGITAEARDIDKFIARAEAKKK